MAPFPIPPTRCLSPGSNSPTPVRDPSGKIIVQNEKLGGIYTSSIVKIPFLRGLVILWDAVGLGTKYLTFSANIQTGEEEKIEGPALTLTIIVSFAIAIGLFFLAPAALVQLFQHWIKISAFIGNLIEGLIRLVFVIGYMWLIGKMPDIHRVFMYHGAEHKSVFAFELKAPHIPRFEVIRTISTL